jgi:hypothetical protein
MLAGFMNGSKYNRNPAFRKKPRFLPGGESRFDIVPVGEYYPLRGPVNLNKKHPFERGIFLAERAGFEYHPLMGTQEPEQKHPF